MPSPSPAAPVPRVEGAVVEHGHARFTILTPVCVRLEYHPERRFVDAPSLFAARREPERVEFDVAHDPKAPKRIVIDTGRLRLTYKDDGRAFFPGNLECHFRHGDEETRWEPGHQPMRNLGGTIDSLDGVRGPVELGRGLLSRDGWHLIDDSETHLLVDAWVQCRPDDAGLDWYLFAYGTDFRAALRSLTAVGGRIPLPRKYALGSWYSRWHAYTSDEYRQIADEYDQNDYPLDILVWDMDWHRQDATSGYGWAWTKGWTGYSWNRDLLPDAENLIAELRDRGIAVTLNVHPHDGVREHEDMYEDFMRELGKDPAACENLPFDAGDRDYMAATFKHAHKPHEHSGVAFWWVDWQQDIDIPTVLSVPGLRHLPWLNELYFRHTSADNRRGMSFSRWAGWGDHRHPIHFSGDAQTNWETLAFEVPFTAVAGNVGCFFWSHDLGGFMGESDAETYARWLQFGAFSATMRLHAAGVDRRPWKWPAWAEASMRSSFELRSRLMPATYSTVARCCRESLPLVRSTYVQHPEWEDAYRNPQQYFFGDHFLVAPVVSPGQGPAYVGRQRVHFPGGTWYNWFTGERFEACRERLVCADLHEFPLYVQGGVPIPMQPFTRRMGTSPITQLVLRCFPGPEGETRTFTLYEDDGLSRDYERGLYRETPLSYRRNGDRATLRIGPAKGDYPDSVKARPCRVELPCTQAPAAATVDGVPVVASYDEGTRTTILDVPERPVEQGVEITVTAAALDSAKSADAAFVRRARGLYEAPPSANSADEFLAAAAQHDAPETVESLMALLGVGVAWIDPDPCGRNQDRELRVFCPPGVLDDDRLSIALEAGEGEAKRDLLRLDLRDSAARGIPLPAPPRDAPAPVLVRLRATRNGHPFEWTRPLRSPQC